MADISDIADPVVTAIYKTYEEANAKEEARTYLGGSIIGDSCARKLWYGFRWSTKEHFEGRLLRLFQTGHLEEPRIVADLRAIGCTVWEVDDRTGKQFSYSDLGGHFRGNLDGVAVDVPGGGKQPHLCEFKTHSAKSFADLKKKGVRLSQPKHFAQMQIYMHWADLKRALYVAKNKDTDELYSERLEYDPVFALQLVAKAGSIIFSVEPPPRLSDNPTWYECKLCTHYDICHGTRVPNLSCRTCCHATPEREGDGEWSCAKHKSHIPIIVQRTGCGEHLPLPFLISFAETIDAGQDWILFRDKRNETYFAVVAESVMPPADIIEQYHPQVYRSSELMPSFSGLVEDEKLQEIREKFDGRIVG